MDKTLSLGSRLKGRPRSGGAKLGRTEIVTMRFDPRLRYLIELAARQQRRTVSSFLEWAAAEALTQVEVDQQQHRTVASEAAALWDVDETDRLRKLAQHYPHLLTYNEQVIWKHLQESESEQGGISVWAKS